MGKYALGVLAGIGMATVALPAYAAINPRAVAVPAVMAPGGGSAEAASPNIQPVWYDRWGRWHGYGGGYHHWHHHRGLRIIIR